MAARMRFARTAIWVPCLLGALAINVLIFGPAAPTEPRPAPPLDERPDFCLSLCSYEDPEAHRTAVPLEVQELALQCTEEEISRALPGQDWIGSYHLAEGLFEGGHRLRLGTQSYVLLYSDDWSDSDWLLVEKGALECDGELLRFHPSDCGPDAKLPRELICVHDGAERWLAEPWLVPAAFYPLEQPGRPFPGVRHAGFVAEEHALDPRGSPRIPAAYTRERERLGSFRLLELLPPAEDGGTLLARFERSNAAPIAPFERLWWDGEVCTLVRACVREVDATSLIAEFDWPSDVARARLAPGALFTRLPRLE